MLRSIANKAGTSQGRVAQIISKFKTEEINTANPLEFCLMDVISSFCAEKPSPNRAKTYSLFC